MTAIDWTSPTWGCPGANVHVGTSLDDRHTASEEAAEVER